VVRGGFSIMPRSKALFIPLAPAIQDSNHEFKILFVKLS
jgi:hypothetical protein